MPNEDIFPSPWNSFMLKYHCFQSAQILLGWIMRQMENKKGKASSECCILGGIDALCWFPASTYFSHLRALSPPSCGDARTREVPGVNYHWRHTRLSGPPPPFPRQIAGHCPAQLSMTCSKERACLGKTSGCGTSQHAELYLRHRPSSRESP